MKEILVSGIPETVEEVAAAVCRSRLHIAARELLEETGLDSLDISIATKDHAIEPPRAKQGVSTDTGEPNLEQRALNYRAKGPLYTMEQLIVPSAVMDEITSAMELIRLEPLIFDGWGLREIEPFPRSVLNLHGPPGTGKTLAAHAIASEMGKPILAASYADIESKFHGDGPKNVEALFHAARRDDALLFSDEADSLLSRRLTSVTQGSEQAINSMRSQLLICLEKHTGLVIFATNLVENYDPAFETRVRHVRFPLPDLEARATIWSKHLPNKLPLDADVNVLELATHSETLCGRDIKNAVIDASIRAARLNRYAVRQIDLLGAVDRVILSKREVVRGTRETLTSWIPPAGEVFPGMPDVTGNP
jgi:SpoVK/Ycf46/Vps4 family AAA+-type ATPase